MYHETIIIILIKAFLIITVLKPFKAAGLHGIQADGRKFRAVGMSDIPLFSLFSYILSAHKAGWVPM